MYFFRFKATGKTPLQERPENKQERGSYKSTRFVQLIGKTQDLFRM